MSLSIAQQCSDGKPHGIHFWGGHGLGGPYQCRGILLTVDTHVALMGLNPDHKESTDCICGPDVENIWAGDESRGPVRRIILHRPIVSTPGAPVPTETDAEA